MPLGTMLDLGPGNILLDADPASPPRGTAPLHISAHFCCAQTAEWIKMPLGTKVGLGPGRIVLHGDPAPPPKRGTAPNFRPMSIVARRSLISTTAERLLHSSRQKVTILYNSLPASLRSLTLNSDSLNDF